MSERNRCYFRLAHHPAVHVESTYSAGLAAMLVGAIMIVLLTLMTHG
jgi:hypothetical protein